MIVIPNVGAPLSVSWRLEYHEKTDSLLNKRLCPVWPPSTWEIVGCDFVCLVCWLSCLHPETDTSGLPESDDWWSAFCRLSVPWLHLVFPPDYLDSLPRQMQNFQLLNSLNILADYCVHEISSVFLAMGALKSILRYVLTWNCINHNL